MPFGLSELPQSMSPLFQLAGDKIDFEAYRKLLHNPDLLADQRAKAGTLAPPQGGGAVIRPPQFTKPSVTGLPAGLEGKLGIPRGLKPGDPHPILDRVSPGPTPHALYAKSLQGLTRQEYEARVKAGYGAPSAKDSAQTSMSPVAPVSEYAKLQRIVAAGGQTPGTPPSSPAPHVTRPLVAQAAQKLGIDPARAEKFIIGALQDGVPINPKQIGFYLALWKQKGLL